MRPALLLLDPRGGDIVSNDEPMTDFMREVYRETRYLDSASEPSLFARLHGLLCAVFDLDTLGGVLYRPVEHLHASALVDLLEEMRLREVPYQDSAIRFSRQLIRRFEPGRVRILAEALQRLRGRRRLFKFMHSAHAHHLLNGNVRFTPASKYANENLNAAIRDNELRLDHVIRGLRITTADGESMPIVGDRISRQSSGEYLISSFSLACDLRLFNLLEYDACVVIGNGTEFAAAVCEQYRRMHPTDTVLFGAVEYLDPFRQLRGKQPIELVKSIDFAFEREYRFVAYNVHEEDSSYEVRVVPVGPTGFDCSLLEF